MAYAASLRGTRALGTRNSATCKSIIGMTCQGQAMIVQIQLSPEEQSKITLILKPWYLRRYVLYLVYVE